VTELGLLLYSDRNTFESLLAENCANLTNLEGATILAYDGKKTIGMAQCSIRREYVEGADSGGAGSKVAYLEGIFVLPECRRRGVASELVAECETWGAAMGCTEFASDCKLGNEESYRFHTKIGFAEVSRNIHFIKRI
jgi:aminoglycoside 6'-N-acetyltransferase I